jgi:hypothetical protein
MANRRECGGHERGFHVEVSLQPEIWAFALNALDNVYAWAGAAVEIRGVIALESTAIEHCPLR